jgi:hypothetical protein
MDESVTRAQGCRVVARLLTAIAGAAAVTTLAFCGGGSPTGPSGPPPATTEVLVGAGDIARCGATLADAEATAKLLDAIPGTVFTAGDNAQSTGSIEEFRDCYGPTWGRHRARTRPSPGNHDYDSGGQPYYDYFGANAGPSGLGYYSYALGAWHILTLNSNVAMSPGSPQAAWLRDDLAKSAARCTVAYWHHPLFSSGPNGSNAFVRDTWRILYEFGTEIVLGGHDHFYERYALQDPDGRADPTRGIRQFIVGTGGMFLYSFVAIQPNSEARGAVHGVLKLTLRPDGYDWNFVAVPGSTFTDSGSGGCH